MNAADNSELSFKVFVRAICKSHRWQNRLTRTFNPYQILLERHENIWNKKETSSKRIWDFLYLPKFILQNFWKWIFKIIKLYNLTKTLLKDNPNQIVTRRHLIRTNEKQSNLQNSPKPKLINSKFSPSQQFCLYRRKWKQNNLLLLLLIKGASDWLQTNNSRWPSRSLVEWNYNKGRNWQISFPKNLRFELLHTQKIKNLFQ